MTAVVDLPESTRRRNLWILIAAAALFHLVVAVSFELTSDEANGWMYARFPAASYFDHPPLWGYLIWLSTFGGSLASVLAIRLPAIALSAATTLLIHRWVRETLGPRAAWHSALLFNLSFLFTGVGAIHLPDAALFFFWLLTLYCLTRALQSGETGTRERGWMLLAGLPLGFAMLSKYHGLLLAPCLFAFLATDPVRRRWLARPEPWISFGLACVFFLPVIAWNAENDWVSFRFQGRRLVDSSDPDPSVLRALINLAAPALILNPYVFVLMAAGVVAAFRRRPGFDRFPIRLLLFASLPVIGFFAVGAVLNESSLPHWPGVGYLGLIPLAGAFLESRVGNRLLPLGARASIAAIALLVGLAVAQIHFGIMDADRERRNDPAFVEYGRRDATTEMIGWKGLDRRLAEIVGDNRDVFLFANRWHTAARLDFYAAAPLGLRVACLSELGQERALAFMRPKGLVVGASGWFVVPSNRFKGETSFADRFERVEEPIALDVTRAGRVAKRFYVYRCHRLRETPPPPHGPRDPLAGLEAGLFFAVNSGLKSPVGDWLIGYSNWLGSGYVGIPIVLVIALRVWWRNPERRSRDIAAGALAGVAVITNVLGVKELCDRPRPLKAFEAAIARGEVQVHGMFSPGSQRGFPSGHTATAFALAAVVAMLLQRRSAVAIAFAVAAVVGVSTLYVGAHRPLDVVGGAMVGSIWTFWAFGIVACCYGSKGRSVP